MLLQKKCVCQYVISKNLKIKQSKILLKKNSLDLLKKTTCKAVADNTNYWTNQTSTDSDLTHYNQSRKLFNCTIKLPNAINDELFFLLEIVIADYNNYEFFLHENQQSSLDFQLLTKKDQFLILNQLVNELKSQIKHLNKSIILNNTGIDWSTKMNSQCVSSLVYKLNLIIQLQKTMFKLEQSY